MTPPVTESVGRYLDSARVGRAHLRQLALLGGGGFFDAFDIYLSGSVVAAMTATGFSGVGGTAAFLSSTSFGLLVGALAAGYIGDRFGRRATYLYALLIYSVATLLTSVAPGHGAVVALRALTGLGLGAVLITGYGTWNEFAPGQRRASWAGVLAMIVNLALPASAIAGLLVIPVWGWRAMFVVCGVPAAVVWLLQLRYLQESPRWLESRGRIGEAYAVARKFNPATPEPPSAEPPSAEPPSAEPPSAEPPSAEPPSAEPPSAEPPRTEPADNEPAGPVPGSEGGRVSLLRGPLGRVTLVCVLIAVCNQIAFYTFQSWVPTYLLGQGFSIEKSLGLTVLMQIGSVPGCLVGGLLGDRLGRKWVNVALFVLMGAVGVWYGYSSSTVELVVSGLLWVFLASFAISVQLASYIPELYPTALRMRGSALANAFARGSVIISPFLVSLAYQHTGVRGVFLGVLAICLVGAVAVAALAPETRRRSLEDIAAALHRPTPPQPVPRADLDAR